MNFESWINLTNGLLAWFPFNGNANDESENGHNGVVSGAILKTDRNGVPNRAYNFDGTQNWISVNGLTGNYTTVAVRFWYKNPIATVKYPTYFHWLNVGWCNEGSTAGVSYVSGDIDVIPGNHGLQRICRDKWR